MSILDIRSEVAPQPGQPVFERGWPSRLDLKPQVLDVITQQLMGPGWVTADDEPWLQLCLDEVIVNAMLHGNEGDPKIPIQVSIFHEDGSWELHVSDKGEGFKAEHVPDPEDPDSLLLEHGRGIRIMIEWLDQLIYYRGGSTAVLRRHCDVPTDPPA